MNKEKRGQPGDRPQSNKNKHTNTNLNYNTKEQSRQEMSSFLSHKEFDWFFTGTFKPSYDGISINGIKHIFFAFLNHIYEKEERYPFFYYCLEVQGQRSTPHIHALIKWNNLSANKFPIIRKQYWKYWIDKYGRNRILPYDTKLGANFYLAKYVNKQDRIVDWSVVYDLDSWLTVRRTHLDFKEQCANRTSLLNRNMKINKNTYWNCQKLLTLYFASKGVSDPYLTGLMQAEGGRETDPPALDKVN